MWKCIYKKTCTARKRYNDDGWENIYNSWDNFTDSEKSKIEELGRPTIIEKGQIYERQFNVDSGDTCTWRTKVFFYELMNKYNLFSDD